MKIIFGLGNPGIKYAHNRHNAGFLAVNFLITHYSLATAHWSQKFQSELLETALGDQKILFAKPQTFMNDSGKAVRELVQFYKLNPAGDILVVHDEVDLLLGTVRSAFDSSSAGNNGVQSIIDELGTQKFHRLRIGVETRASRAQMDTRDFVLQNFTDEELETLGSDVFPKVKIEIEKFLENSAAQDIN